MATSALKFLLFLNTFSGYVIWPFGACSVCEDLNEKLSCFLHLHDHCIKMHRDFSQNGMWGAEGWRLFLSQQHKWGQSLILKVSEHPTTGTFSWPLPSACDYPTALSSPLDLLECPRNPIFLFPLQFSLPKSLGPPFWASWQGKRASRSGIHPLEEVVWVLRNTFFFPPH